MFKPELLAPAGSMESLVAAVNNGCDAVYLGASAFSARQNARNFTLEEIKSALYHCKLYNVKLYVALNVLVKENEMADLLMLVEKLYQFGVDAFILQDIGAASNIIKYIPECELHASTQMSIHHLQGVLFLQSHGFKRIVLSRELSLKEIKLIRSNSSAELECFVHGALCASYSGQCLMSSFQGGRSGNRGYCAQNCRLPYELIKPGKAKPLLQGHLLSCKDLMSLYYLPDLIDAGIHSFKIEGRMKNPAYAAVVSGMYRKYIDRYCTQSQPYQVDKEDIKKLTQIFCREKFTKGYFYFHSGSEMLSLKSPKHAGLQIGHVTAAQANRCQIMLTEPVVPGDGITFASEALSFGCYLTQTAKKGDIIEVYTPEPVPEGTKVNRTFGKKLSDFLKNNAIHCRHKIELTGHFTAHLNEPVSLTVYDSYGHMVKETGAIATMAEKRGAEIAAIEKQLNKTGSTPFVFSKITVDLDTNIFLKISDINYLRRLTLESLEKVLGNSGKKKIEIEYQPYPKYIFPLPEKKLHILIRSQEQWQAILETTGVSRIYVEEQYIVDNVLIEKTHKQGIQIYLCLPSIDNEMLTEHYYGKLTKENHIDGLLIRTYNQWNVFEHSSLPKIIDYTLQIFNRSALYFWQSLGASHATFSPELTLKEIEGIGYSDSELLVYGYIPYMVTRQCPIGTFANKPASEIWCRYKDKNQRLMLKDQKQLYHIMPYCNQYQYQCYCKIFSENPVSIDINTTDLNKLTPNNLRLELLYETKKETADLIYNINRIIKNDNPCQAKENLAAIISSKKAVNGHYYKNVK